ncbi:type II secretion system protein GspM [Pseudomonas gingeri]
MRLRLTAREQRGMALVLAAATLCTAYFLGIHWWFTAALQSIADEMDTLRANQERYQALQAQRPVLEAQLAAAKNAPQNSERLLSDSDTGAATAQLMQLVSSKLQTVALQGGSCNMTNRMPIAASESGPYKQVKVSINLDCSIQPLSALLYQLESERISLFVDVLSIRRSPQQTPEQNHRLSAQILVSAYTRNGAAKETSQ